MSPAAALAAPTDFPRDLGIRLRQDDGDRFCALALQMDLTYAALARMILTYELRRGIQLQVPRADALPIGAEQTNGRPAGRATVYPITISVRLPQDEANILGVTATAWNIQPSSLGRLILIKALRAPEGIQLPPVERPSIERADASATAWPAISPASNNVHPIRPLVIVPAHVGPSPTPTNPTA
jgi:hypothetical protein